ncbi:hypothetical protein [Burkholderia lata]|uniref:hypothetical protein n=1 Tax=Burkholderia lata (strain ATCC 17760 / DSM 23089 / LMG 22485 / NCIMB 9086 / R18194 / 383) TaxID=482957 RepID=UPI001583D8E2|nr:hypothetical protein [Burkholderia lata]
MSSELAEETGKPILTSASYCLERFVSGATGFVMPGVQAEAVSLVARVVMPRHL